MVSWGGSAVSQEQLAGLMVGDEAYAGARNFEALQDSVRDVFGHRSSSLFLPLSWDPPWR